MSKKELFQDNGVLTAEGTKLASKLIKKHKNEVLKLNKKYKSTELELVYQHVIAWIRLMG